MCITFWLCSNQENVRNNQQKQTANNLFLKESASSKALTTLSLPSPQAWSRYQHRFIGCVEPFWKITWYSRLSINYHNHNQVTTAIPTNSKVSTPTAPLPPWRTPSCGSHQGELWQGSWSALVVTVMGGDG